MEDLSLEDNVGVRVKGIGGEVGKVGRETRERKVGIPADSIAWKEEDQGVATKRIRHTGSIFSVKALGTPLPP
jgi:hypothetical protein